VAKRIDKEPADDTFDWNKRDHGGEKGGIAIRDVGQKTMQGDTQIGYIR